MIDDDDDDDDDGWGRRRDGGVILSKFTSDAARPIGIVSVLARPRVALLERLTPLQQSVRGFLLAFDVPTLLFVRFVSLVLIFSR